MDNLNLNQKHGREHNNWYRNKKIWIIAGIAVAAVYIAGIAFYSNHFYTRSKAFGLDMVNKSAATLNNQIEDKLGDYTLNIKTRDGKETISGSQLDLVYNGQSKIKEALKAQNPFLWFTMPFTSQKDIGIQVAYDSSKLESAMDSLDCFQKANVKSPADAHLEYKNGAYTIVAETQGNELDSDKTLQVLENAVEEGDSSVSLDDASCYKKPSIYKDDKNLSKEKEEVNQLLKAKITYDFGDRTELVDADVINKFITFGDDYTFKIDKNLVYEYVHSLGLKYDTFGLSRKFKTSSGKVITLKGGDYGWCINKDKTTQDLIKYIKAGTTKTVEPTYLYSGIDRDTNDIGGTYVEVSIAKQTMWCYKNGKLVVKTPVVTGNVSLGHGTPSGGVWAIDAKMKGYTLSGQGYNAPVTFWLPFNGNVGIHDSSWRSSYGGQIYKTNGSHGCVNTPYAAAKKIFSVMDIGYPVVVY